MTMHRSLSSVLASAARRSRYSMAVAGSWIEQGPTITSRRSLRPMIMLTASLRPLTTVSTAASVMGISEIRRSGGIRGSWPRTVRVSGGPSRHAFGLNLFKCSCQLTSQVVDDEGGSVTSRHFGGYGNRMGNVSERKFGSLGEKS